MNWIFLVLKRLKGWYVQMVLQSIVKYLMGRMSKRVLRAAVDAAAEEAKKTINPIDDVVVYIAGIVVDALPGDDD